MSVVIRLRRIGKNPKKRPHFRVSVFEESRGRDSKFIEELGFYSPLTGKAQFDSDRLGFWVKNGAQLSDTVKSLVKKSRAAAKKEEKNASGTS
ncbi:MAG: 30S ribosomal protein S16 [Candidatus Omnitrophica bacterium]|nr:30S ribosomal protein S16 [Candidatus Omnitrophota bacterium]MDD5553175.1 30S ribosomal protein S16 [Candidatus Omnitrophota bacterium]